MIRDLQRFCRKIAVSLICVSIICLIVVPIYCNCVSKIVDEPCFWLHGGLGINSSVSLVGAELVMGTGIGIQDKNRIYSFRWIGSIGFHSDVGGSELALLYGICSKRRRSLVSLSVGLGYFPEEFQYGDGTSNRRIGLAFESQTFFAPTPIVGIELYGFANLNRRGMFVGVIASIPIGKLW